MSKGENMKNQNQKIRSIRFDDYLWKELDKTSKKIGQRKSNIIRAAVIEKLLKIERGIDKE
jgi:predicted DNA-binding protein